MFRFPLLVCNSYLNHNVSYDYIDLRIFLLIALTKISDYGITLTTQFKEKQTSNVLVYIVFESKI
jgi:hypothetical protein